MVDEKLKPEFARYLFEEPDSDAFKAALRLCPQDTGAALWVATNWAFDSDVLEIIKELRNDDANIQSLASKYDIAKMFLEIAKISFNPKDRREALRDYCTIAGIYDFNSKSSAPTVNIENAPRVMLVKDFGDSDEWEQKLIAQQEALTSGNHDASKHVN